MSWMELCPYSYFWCCGYFWGPWVPFITTDSSQWGSQKLLHRLVYHELTAYLSVFNLFLSQWIMAILSKGCKPDSFEPHHSLRLSFTNIQGLHSNFVECESFLDSNSPDILTGCDTSLSVLLLFPLSISFFVCGCARFFILFHLT